MARGYTDRHSIGMSRTIDKAPLSDLYDKVKMLHPWRCLACGKRTSHEEDIIDHIETKHPTKIITEDDA